MTENGVRRFFSPYFNFFEVRKFQAFYKKKVLNYLLLNAHYQNHLNCKFMQPAKVERKSQFPKLLISPLSTAQKRNFSLIENYYRRDFPLLHSSSLSLSQISLNCFITRYFKFLMKLKLFTLLLSSYRALPLAFVQSR